MKTQTVVRCPECGSTRAGESGGMYDLTFMMCSDCGNSGHCDHWQIKFDWNLEIAMPDDAQELPRFVSPLPPEDAANIPVKPSQTTPAIKKS